MYVRITVISRSNIHHWDPRGRRRRAGGWAAGWSEGVGVVATAKEGPVMLPRRGKCWVEVARLKTTGQLVPVLETYAPEKRTCTCAAILASADCLVSYCNGRSKERKEHWK